jgi:glycerophosphoryl diester phosphodiesterase
MWSVDSLARASNIQLPTRSSSSAWARSAGMARTRFAVQGPMVWGHRGAKARAPENTLGAFAAAITDGACGVELDVQLSQDRVPVVLHDDTLDRTTELKGAPWRFSAAELGAADAAGWFGLLWSKPEHVPTLDAVFRAMPDDSVVNVELKGPSPAHQQLERSVLDVIERHHTRVHVIVSSFHPAQLLEVRRLWPSLPIGLLLDDSAIFPLRVGMAARALRPDAIHPPASLVDERLVRRCREQGVAVHVWGIRNEPTLLRMLHHGVDALIVDDVAQAVKATQTNAA